MHMQNQYMKTKTTDVTHATISQQKKDIRRNTMRLHVKSKYILVICVRKGMILEILQLALHMQNQYMKAKTIPVTHVTISQQKMKKHHEATHEGKTDPCDLCEKVKDFRYTPSQ